MKLLAHPTKDIIRFEVFQSTDVASLGLWDSNGMQWIQKEEDVTTELVKAFTETQEKIKNKAVLVNTGADGNYRVIVYINERLTEDDSKRIHKKHQGIKLETEGILYLGSPAWAGFRQQESTDRNLIDVIELAAGKYVVNTYSLLVKDAEGTPKYIQFVFEIFAEEKYPYEGVERVELDKAAELKY